MISVGGGQEIQKVDEKKNLTVGIEIKQGHFYYFFTVGINYPVNVVTITKMNYLKKNILLINFFK